MSSYKNARLTWQGRRLLVERIAEMGLVAAARAAGVSLRTARKRLARFESDGLDGLLRVQLLKIAAAVVRNARRVRILLASSQPMRGVFLIAARALAP